MTQPQYDADSLIEIYKISWNGKPTKSAIAKHLGWLYSEADKLSYDEHEKFHDLLRGLARNATFEVKL